MGNGVWCQVIATVLLCFSCTNMGIINAWPSSTILLFQSSNTTLHRIMEPIEISLFSSLPAIGSLIANPVAGLVLDRLGRKRSAILTSMIFVIAWSIIAVTRQVELILVAMLVAGLGCAIFFETTIYISEICQDSIRGTMTAGPMQFYLFGFLVSYFLGGCLSYSGMIYACLSLAVCGVLMLAVLKESPVTLMSRGKEMDAANSIAFYRRKNNNAREVICELNKLRRVFHTNVEDTEALAGGKKMETGLATPKMSCWNFFKHSPSTRREFYLIMVLKIAFVFQGLPVVTVYAEPMFAKAVPEEVMSPNLCSVLMGVVMLITGSLAAYLTDVVGRRPLMIYASICTGFCCIVLGAQLSTEFGPKWVIPLFMYVYVSFYNVGAGTVPVVILAEVFLPEVKSIMSMLLVEWAWILNFLVVFVFNYIVIYFGLPCVFYIFSLACFGTAMYCHYYMPETKGLPVYAIQDLFIKKRSGIQS